MRTMFFSPAVADIILPQDSTPLGIQTEMYEPPTTHVGRNTNSLSREAVGRSLLILNLQDNKQVFMVGGSVPASDRYNPANSSGSGFDEAGVHHLNYSYDGIGTITEYLGDDSSSVHTGEAGNPDLLVKHYRGILGECVDINRIGQSLPPSQVFI